MNIELEEILSLEKQYRTTLVNKISGLKSANLIGTKNAEGVSNLAIFNSVVHIGANPPLIGFINRPLVVERHTYSNIKQTGFFTINHVSQEMHKKAHQTSAKYKSTASEFTHCGFEEDYIDEFPIPFVKSSHIKIGLSFVEEQTIQANNTKLIIGRVEKIVIANHIVMDDGDIDLSKLDSVAIGGLDTYYSCDKINRYNYARVDQKLKPV